MILLVLAALFLAFAPPILSGFHVGCNAYDHLRETRLGVEFCK